MFEIIKSRYHLVCDVCGEEAEREFYDFNEAVAYKKANDWKSQKYGDVWQDICPDCQDT